MKIKSKNFQQNVSKKRPVDREDTQDDIRFQQFKVGSVPPPRPEHDRGDVLHRLPGRRHSHLRGSKKSQSSQGHTWGQQSCLQKYQ